MVYPMISMAPRQMLLGSAGILKGDDMRPFGNVNSVLVPRVKLGGSHGVAQIAMGKLGKGEKIPGKHTQMIHGAGIFTYIETP